MTGGAANGSAESRTYQRTHPWLTFSFDLRRLRHADWLALGEAAAMAEWIAGAPLDPTVAEELHKLYLAKGALATTAIEGNTLSEEEARSVIEGALELPPSRSYLGREVRNIVEACNALGKEVAKRGRLELTVERIESMNATVLAGLEADDHVAPGHVRAVNVSVGSYSCPDWRDARHLLERLCTVLNDFPIPEERRYAYSILKAIFAHLYFVWIHPFGDGNGRTARLIEFAILLEAGLPTPACHLPSNHYNLTRTAYYRQLARASQSDDGIYGFAGYAIAGMVDQLNEQTDAIRRHQREVAWINFVHEQFRGAESATARRQRSLLLALSRTGREIRISELRNLNPEVAREYAKVTYRTLVRDVVALVRRDLAVLDQGGVRAKQERILAFLPWRNEPSVEAD